MDQPENPILRRYHDLRQYLGFSMMELEKAFKETPRIVEETGFLMAQADANENAARHTLDIIKAEAGARIRAVTVGGKEPSEARIAALLPMERDVQDARAALDVARYETQVCTSLYKSFDTQSRLLGKAADMINSGYIATSAAYATQRNEIRQARYVDDLTKQQSKENRIGRPVS